MISDRLFSNLTTHTVRTAFLAFTMSMLMTGIAYGGGGTAGTFEANAPLTVTASVTGMHEVEAEQYKLTVEKGTGVNEVTLTPSSADGFYDKGTAVTVQSATYNTGYEADSGIGQSYIMDSARSASVTAKKITYAVTYNYNLPSGWTNNGGLPAAQTKIYGDNLALSSAKPAVPTKATDTSYTSGGTGYQYKKTYSATFKEWNTKADGTGTAYAAGGTYSSNAAVTLYAIWTTSTGKTGEQYYLTVNKGTNMQSVTGSGWYNKGTTATASGTANSNYTESSFTSGGTGYQYKKTHTYTVNTQKPVMDSAKSVTITATDTTGKASEQYYLTVNKDSGVSTATASQWVNKGDSVKIVAAPKAGYEITGGTGSTGTINAAKTVNITSRYGYIVDWSSVTDIGSYLGSATSGSPGNKSIVYTNTSGQTAYANPYMAGYITVKPGTAITFRMMAGSSTSCRVYKGSASSPDAQDSGTNRLLSISFTPISSTTIRFTDSGAISGSNSKVTWGIR